MLEYPMLKIIQYNLRNEPGAMTALFTDKAVQEMDVP